MVCLWFLIWCFFLFLLFDLGFGGFSVFGVGGLLFTVCVRVVVLTLI